MINPAIANTQQSPINLPQTPNSRFTVLGEFRSAWFTGSLWFALVPWQDKEKAAYWLEKAHDHWLWQERGKLALVTSEQHEIGEEFRTSVSLGGTRSLHGCIWKWGVSVDGHLKGNRDDRWWWFRHGFRRVFPWFSYEFKTKPPADLVQCRLRLKGMMKLQRPERRFEEPPRRGHFDLNLWRIYIRMKAISSISHGEYPLTYRLHHHWCWWSNELGGTQFSDTLIWNASAKKCIIFICRKDVCGWSTKTCKALRDQSTSHWLRMRHRWRRLKKDGGCCFLVGKDQQGSIRVFKLLVKCPCTIFMSWFFPWVKFFWP